MRTRARAEGFTGFHMLFAMLAFFGVIIAVNLTMAFFARSSWTGFVVENSYVASQQFNGKMAETRAQAALGWQSELLIKDGFLRYDLRDSKGAEISMKSVSVTFRRPVDDREDHTVLLVRDPQSGFSASHDLADGAWLVEVEADAGLDFPYRETLRLQVRGRTVQ
jgi:nitrogen fixation protein FixH